MRPEAPFAGMQAAQGPGVDDYRYWKPEVQQKALQALHDRKANPWRPFFCKNRKCSGDPHITAVTHSDCQRHEWEQRDDAWACRVCNALGVNQDGWTHPHARANQHPPPWNEPWQTFIAKSGRGWGKTLVGSHITHQVARRAPHLALIAPTGPDIRETLVEGPTGILATSDPKFTPAWEPSRKRLVWPNGAIGYGLSAEEPDRIRSKNLAYAWLDEAAFMPAITEVWSNLLFALRVKNGLDGKPLRNHILITTTPKPTKWIKERTQDPRNIVISGSTYENIHNLSEEYRDAVLGVYEGTRLGRQEIYGEILEDVEGALWQASMLNYTDNADDLERIVVAVDPAGTANKRSDETGIVVVGWTGKKAIVLADYTDRYSPNGWGSKAWWAHEKWSADAIVAEKNYGGDMVKHVLETESHERARIILVTSRRGKQLRAEPIVAQYEREKVLHLRASQAEDSYGGLAKLEEEMLSWVPGEGASPNRVDALVHGLTDLVKSHAPMTLATPSQVLGNRPAASTVPGRHRRAM